MGTVRSTLEVQMRARLAAAVAAWMVACGPAKTVEQENGLLGFELGTNPAVYSSLVQLKQVADVNTGGIPPRVLYRAITHVKAPVDNVTNVRVGDASKVTVHFGRPRTAEEVLAPGGLEALRQEVAELSASELA